MLLTVSVAKLMMLVVTSRGCTTFSSKIFVMHPFLTLIPAVVSPSAWRFLNSVTVEMGLRPAFSARVAGITSRALAKALEKEVKIKIDKIKHRIKLN